MSVRSLFLILGLVACGCLSCPAQNLVLNGNGELGTTEGFPGAVLDGTDKAVGSASFRYDQYYTVAAGEYIAIEPGQRYRFAFYAKSNNTSISARAYTQLFQYDIDKNIIDGWNVYFVGDTTTTLSQPLLDGHDKIHLTNASNWVDSGVWHYRGIKFWEYSNSLGYEYEAERYTRYYKATTSNGSTGIWDEGVGLVDKASGIIHLSEPWSDGSWGIGTEVSQNVGGGHFYLKHNFLIPEEWTLFEFIIEPSYFQSATVFVKPGWLMNYQTPGSSMSISGISLERIPSIPEISVSDGFVGIGVDDPTNKLEVAGTIRAEEVIVEAQPWADYVFEDGYELLTLADVASHIEEHGHLPGVPSEYDVARGGLSVGQSQALMMAKIEELTLYILQQEQRIKRLEEKLNEKN